MKALELNEESWGELTLSCARCHNLDGFRKVFEFLSSDRCTEQDNNCYDYLYLALSKRSYRDVKAIINLVVNSSCFYKRLILIEFDHPKALDWDDDRLMGLIDSCSLQFNQNWQDSLEKIKNSNKKVMVMGSLYFLGQLKRFIKN